MSAATWHSAGCRYFCPGLRALRTLLDEVAWARSSSASTSALSLSNSSYMRSRSAKDGRSSEKCDRFLLMVLSSSAARAACNETRALSLMRALRVNSGTSYWPARNKGLRDQRRSLQHRPPFFLPHRGFGHGDWASTRRVFRACERVRSMSMWPHNARARSVPGCG
jgi:hypothetical protein